MLSVLIVSWNTRELLRKCLASIEEHKSSHPREVIVVDNASSDGTAGMVSEHFPWVRLIANPKNTGYAAGNNLAFEAATGAWLLTLNPDTEILDDSLDRALDLMEAHPDCGCLGARLVGVDGKTQKSVRGFPTLFGILGDVTKLAALAPRSSLASYRLPAFDYEREQEAPQPMGTFLLFRRSALEAIGSPSKPFDEGFPIFFNEVDLLFRLRRAGYRCLYAPSVKVLHHGGESTKQVRKSMIWESHKSLVRFLRKHYRTRWNGPALWAVAGFIYAGAFVRARGYDAGFRA
jgi:GT2 family glycosyltransferase